MINKKNFIDMVQEKLNAATDEVYSKKMCETVINAVVDSITDILVAGDSVRFGDFGVFEVAFKAGREGKSAFDGTPWKSNDTIVPKFRASKNLKELVGKTYNPKMHKNKK